MSFNLLFWKKEVEVNTTETGNRQVNCKCGSGKNYEDCHELEFALPVGERPDPD